MLHNFYEQPDTKINRNTRVVATYKTATAIAATWMRATMLPWPRDVEY